MLQENNTKNTSEIILQTNYFTITNFRGYIFPQILCFLIIFAKLNTRKIFLQLKFVKINTRKKSLSGGKDKKDITFEIPHIHSKT